MATVHELMEHASGLIADNREEASATGARYRFELSGVDACMFVVDLTETAGLRENDSETEVDCTIRMDSTDFVSMAEGEIDSRELFFAGKLQVDGDMGLALQLKKLHDSVDTK